MEKCSECGWCLRGERCNNCGLKSGEKSIKESHPEAVEILEKIFGPPKQGRDNA